MWVHVVVGSVVVYCLFAAIPHILVCGWVGALCLRGKQRDKHTRTHQGPKNKNLKMKEQDPLPSLPPPDSQTCRICLQQIGPTQPHRPRKSCEELPEMKTLWSEPL